jgi:hypothetical protein
MHIIIFFPIPWDQGWKVIINYNDPKGLRSSYYTYMSKMASLRFNSKCKDMHVWWSYYINSNPYLSHKFTHSTHSWFKYLEKGLTSKGLFLAISTITKWKLMLKIGLCSCIILNYNIQFTILEFFLQLGTNVHV